MTEGASDGANAPRVDIGRSVLDRLALDLALPLVLAAVTGLAFGSWWSQKSFERPWFTQQYTSGIYRYRVLGRWVVTSTADLLKNWHPTQLWPPWRQDAIGTNNTFAIAYVLVNLIVFVLFCVALRRVIWTWSQSLRATLVYVSLIVIVALTGFVVTPYDFLSYLFLALFALVFLLPDRNGPWAIAAVAGAAAAGALGMATRETAYLSVCFGVAATLVYRPRLALPWIKTITTTAAIGVVYVWLRIVYGTSKTLWEDSTFGKNLPDAGWLGLLIAALFYVVLYWIFEKVGLLRLPDVGKAVGLMYAFALPYILVIAFTGYWFEVRLVVPLYLMDTSMRVTAAVARDRPDEGPDTFTVGWFLRGRTSRAQVVAGSRADDEDTVEAPAPTDPSSTAD